MFLQQVAGGLAAGGLYGLLAVAIVLIFRVSEVANFAQGELAMVTTFVTYHLLKQFGLPLWAAFMLALVYAAIQGLAVYTLVVRVMSKAEPMKITVATLGVQIAVNALAVKLWATNQPYPFPAVFPREAVNIGGLVMSKLNLGIIGITMLLILALFLFFRLTMAGLVMRAVAQDRDVATLMGVSVGRVVAQTWMLGGVIGALAGLLFAPITFLATFMMQPFQLKAFTAAILGGMTSWPGVIIGGMLFGVVENIAAAYVSNQLQPAIAYVVIVLVLLVRPAGLFGQMYKGRV